MVHIHSFIFNSFEEKTYVVYDDTNEAIIIDPGCYEPSEEEQLHKFIQSQKLTVKYLLSTHSHIDHVLGNAFVKDKYNVPLLIHKEDESTLYAVKAYAPSYGFVNYRAVDPDKFIQEGDKVEWGSSNLEVLYLPGHAPGHIGFYQPDQKIIISGDVLFKGSIGRTDLPGGNTDVLLKSIHQKLFTLTDDVVVYPGHGDKTTLGAEKASNPFCGLASQS